MLSTINIPNAEICNTTHVTSQIITLNAKETEYEYFFEHCMAANTPCLITNISTNWNCFKHWVSADKQINFEYISEHYGHSSVPVANCSEKFYNSQKKIDMKLDEYLKYCSTYKNANFDENIPILYLKDWHFRKNFPNDILYEVPKYFASDWLNEYSLDNTEDDYMFVYMGPKGTWTPFHADVYSSFSWSVNVTGKKRWMLFPPNSETGLVDRLGHLPYDITQIQEFRNIQYYEIFQNPDEAIFVPSRWYHQVWNVENTLSINHNWINGCNIKIVWEALVQSLSEIKTEISDCQEMEMFNEHCQLMLNAVFGMDFFKFFKILCHVSKKRINQLLKSEQIMLFDNFTLGNEHCKYDLKCILTVLKKIIEDEDIMIIECSLQDVTPHILIDKIEDVL